MKNIVISIVLICILSGFRLSDYPNKVNSFFSLYNNSFSGKIKGPIKKIIDSNLKAIYIFDSTQNLTTAIYFNDNWEKKSIKIPSRILNYEKGMISTVFETKGNDTTKITNYVFEKGKLTKTTEYSYKENKKIHIRIRKYAYLKNGIVKTTDTYTNGKTFHTEYSIDKSQKILKEIKTKVPTGYDIDSNLYKYDKKGRTVDLQYFTNGRLLRHDISNYEDDFLMKKTTSSDWEGCFEKELTVYDKDKNVLSITQWDCKKKLSWAYNITYTKKDYYGNWVEKYEASWDYENPSNSSEEERHSRLIIYYK